MVYSNSTGEPSSSRQGSSCVPEELEGKEGKGILQTEIQARCHDSVSGENVDC